MSVTCRTCCHTAPPWGRADAGVAMARIGVAMDHAGVAMAEQPRAWNRSRHCWVRFAMHRGLAGILALSAAVAASVPAAALACMNAVAETDTGVAAVKETERLLDDGDPAGARSRAEKILEALRYEDPPDPSPYHSGLRDRTSRILALADVRLDRGGPLDRERRALLEHAADEIERLAADHPTDAAKRTDLGEALARTRPREAREILEDLADHDVVTTPYGYIALARLRAAAGDEKGRDEARARCALMAKTSSICRLEPLPRILTIGLPCAVVAAAVVAAEMAARRAASPTTMWRRA